MQQKKLFLIAVLLGLFICANVLVNGFVKKNAALPSKPIPKSFFTQAPRQKEIIIATVGDIGLGREINWQIQQRNDPTFPFQKTAEILKEADLTIGNLEGPLVENCPLTRTGMKFCGNPKNTNGLVFAGFDLMNLANNHINNYGPEGVEQTVKALDKHRIDYFGLGKISYQTIKGLKIAFLGFDDITQPVNEKKLIQEIQEAQNQAKFIIINFHWGIEYQGQPSERQKHLAHLAIDNGASLIIGHHPHVIQPIEHYQNTPIIYSLGNFVFDQMWSQETRTGIIALITINNYQVKKVNLIPVLIQYYCQPRPIPEPEKSTIINRILPLQ